MTHGKKQDKQNTTYMALIKCYNCSKEYSDSRTSEILECIETYVYNEKEGIKNINPCFDKAWKNVKQGAAFDRSFDVGFNFAVDAKDCNCK